MDPMQIQNQQNQQQVPVNPVQVPVQQPVQGQVFVPQQPIPGQYQQPVAQPVQPTTEQDGVFDKILKGIVDFIAKLAGQTPHQQTNTTQTQVVTQQPVQQTVPQQGVSIQNIPGQVGGFLGQLGTGLENMINQAAQATQTYINQPIETQPTAANMQQQILNQNYQQTPVQVQPVQTPVDQTVTPAQPAVVQQPVAPVQTPIQQ